MGRMGQQGSFDTIKSKHRHCLPRIGSSGPKKKGFGAASPYLATPLQHEPCRTEAQVRAKRHLSKNGCFATGGLGISPVGFLTVKSSNSSDGMTKDTMGAPLPREKEEKGEALRAANGTL